jgi:hypothetical protein
MERENFNEIIENHENFTYPTQKIFDLNEKMLAFNPMQIDGMSLCGENTKKAPSNYEIDPTLIYPICRDFGNGNKTIVVFGNSHAIFSHPGIAYIFRNVYSEISTIFEPACVPLPVNQQQNRLSTVLRL